MHRKFMRKLFALATWWMIATAAAAAANKTSYPPLPEAFSSFGAAVSDGYVYVYGGHIAKTHTYSTEAVTGKFRRLKRVLAKCQARAAIARDIPC